MRVHRLEIEAFGPFVQRQVIDLDALAAQHLFLLHGETGAGKTTVLDALCFGLYGVVPGVRQGAGHLRSDHAPPDAEPRVDLEVTVRGRRLRLTRTPRWQRPKKRGSGTTTAQASVTLQECVAGQWVHLSSRIDETNHLLGELTGLTAEQFCQVVLLPQGQFATFLRAGSDERRGLLQKIFAASRFADVERWLVDRRQQTRRRSEVHHHGARTLLSRVTESAGAAAPEHWTDDDLSAPTASGELTDHVAEVVESAARTATTCARRATHAEETLLAVRARHDRAVRLADQVERAERARRRLDELDARAAQLLALGARRDAALRARPVAQAARGLDAAVSSQEEADDLVLRTGVQASVAVQVHGEQPSLSTPPRRDQVEGALRRLADRRGRALALRDVSRDRETALSRVAALDAEIEGLEQTVEALTAASASVPAEHGRLTADLARLRPVADLRTARALEHDRAVARSGAARELEQRETEVRHGTDRVQQLRQTAQDLREEYLACRERRIAGMASEIAHRLVVGQDCPVCGSCDHPSPASRAAAAETAESEEVARRAAEDADLAHQVAEQELVAVRSHRDAARAASDGLGVEAARERLAAARQDLDESEHAVRDLRALESSLADLEARRAQLEADLATARSRSAVGVAARQEARAQAQTAGSRLDAAAAEFPEGLVDEPHDVEAWVQVFARHERDLTALREALLAQETAASLHRAAGARVADCLEESGFASLEEALAATLDDDAVQAAAEQIDQAARARHTAESVLAEMPPEVGHVLDGRDPRPDLDRSGEHLRRAETTARDLSTALVAAEQRRERLTELESELGAALASWSPVREQLRTVTELAATAEGKGPDNPLQMRLSAYVLASRLSQVVAAANARLETMAEQRYELEHTAFKGAGDRRGGLSLRVVDSWTGEARDPATLSGGETFVVALALALGLADVVTAEAGGAEIDTLFVDEGFGSLDPHTLDRVMDCLDDLRSGGRAVGVVSHVAELKDRIPDQLHVVKTPRGSQVRAVHADLAAAGEPTALIAPGALV
ncbi:SMC family ATPase [Nocardioidaceae bacterium]|nr:SMC family ATPase [Nocardioidaceae bacterium]